MDSTRLKRILTIVDTVISLNPMERPGYLTSVCGDDEVLKNEVLNLLKSIDKSEEFWDGWQDWNEQQIQKFFKEENESEDWETNQAGPWNFLKLLGHGGMGKVFLAERADGQYEQQAAVKILIRGLEYGKSLQRFEQERQILAKLGHPSIASLYDGGVTDDGRPWLAMQYVDGVPITEWCKQHNSSLHERLSLFEKVCEAVRYAHTNLIVHRDLKPDNILVSREGEVKVLDFGIAKLVGGELTETKRIQTQTGLRVMSLDYAAPEQVVGEPVTTATDVYALGLLLYEMLTDSSPFDLQKKNQRQIEQIIRNQDPPKPSSVSEKWKSDLKGDLDAIILKALRKEPEHRYENGRLLLDDIRRYRSNLPVTARSHTIRYQLGKFYKRHTPALATVAIVLLTVTSLSTYYTIQLGNERNEAQLQTKKAEQVTTFLTDLFSASDPGEALGETVTADQLLQRGTERIEETLNNDPETKAEMLEVLGTVYRNLGEYEKARVQLEESLELRKMYSGSVDAGIAKVLNKMGVVLLYQGESAKAKEVFLEANSIHQKLKEPNFDDYASTLNNLAAIHLRQNELDSAEMLLRQAIEFRREHLNEDSEKLATNLDGLAMTLEQKGETENAGKFYREALTLRQSKLDANHPDVARSLNNLAGFMLRQQNLVEAASMYRQSLTIWRKVLGGKHPDVARALNNLAAVLERQEKLNEAEEMFRESVSIKREILDENHLSLANSLVNLGLLLKKKENFEAAEPLLIESLRIRRHNFTEPHPAVAKGINNLASLYEDTEQYGLAVSYYREEIAMRSEITPADSSQIAFAEIGLATCLTALSEFEEAERLLVDNYSKIENKIDQQDPYQQFLLQKMMDLYTAWKKPNEASFYQAMLDQQ